MSNVVSINDKHRRGTEQADGYDFDAAAKHNADKQRRLRKERQNSNSRTLKSYRIK